MADKVQGVRTNFQKDQSNARKKRKEQIDRLDDLTQFNTIEDWDKEVSKLSPQDQKAINKKRYQVEAMIGTRNNVAKASAAVQPSLNTTRDVSVASTDKAVQAVNKAEKERNEAKMQPVSKDPVEKAEQKAKIAESESKVQKATKAATDDIVANPNTDENFKDPNEEEEVKAFAGAPKEVQQEAKEIIPENFEDADDEGKKQIAEKFMEDNGLLKDGKVQKYKMSGSHKLAIVATIATALLSVISGGTLPIIPFTAFTKGTEEENQKAYDLALENIEKTYGDLYDTEQKAKEDPNTAKKAGEYEFASSGNEAQLRQSLKNQMEVLKQSQANSKEMAQLLYEQNTHQLPESLKIIKEEYPELYKDKEFLKNLATLRASEQGITPNQLAGKTIQQYEEIISAPVKDVAEVVGKVVGGK